LSAVAHIKDYKTGKFYRDDFRGNISWNGYEHNVLLRNEGVAPNGTLQFTDVAMASGADDIRDSRGIATADFDNDGDLDVIVSILDGKPLLLENAGGNKSNWLGVQLTGTKANRTAVGARVKVTSDGLTQYDTVRAGSSYLSATDPRLHFGLGTATHADVEVTWPGGGLKKVSQVKVNQMLSIVQN